MHLVQRREFGLSMGCANLVKPTLGHIRPNIFLNFGQANVALDFFRMGSIANNLLNAGVTAHLAAITVTLMLLPLGRGHARA